jgi:hypothetical protein
MAATIELFETGRTLHESRPLRPNRFQQCEAIARAKYVQQVQRKRIALVNWSQCLAGMAAQPRLVLRSGLSRSDVLSTLQKECAGSQQEQQLVVEANADTSGEGRGALRNVEPGKEPMAGEVADSDKVKNGCGKEKTSNVSGRDIWDGEDMSVNTPSTNAQRKRKGKGRRSGHRNTPALTPQPAGKSTEEDDVVALEKSGSSALSKKDSPVNTAKNPDPALHPKYGKASRSSRGDTEKTGHTASVPAEAAKMDELSDRTSTMALEGDQERPDIDRSQVKDSSGKLSTSTTCNFPILTSSKVTRTAGTPWHREKIASLLTKILRFQHPP